MFVTTQRDWLYQKFLIFSAPSVEEGVHGASDQSNNSEDDFNDELDISHFEEVPQDNFPAGPAIPDGVNGNMSLGPQGASTPLHPAHQGHAGYHVPPPPGFHHPTAGHSYAMPPQVNQNAQLPPVPQPQILPTDNNQANLGSIRHRRKSAESARLAAQPFVAPRSRTLERPSAVKSAPANGASDSVPKHVLMDIIRAMSANNQAANDGRNLVQAQQNPQPSTSSAPVYHQPTHVNPAINAMQSQPFPLPEGWSRVGLPARRLVDGVPARAKTPSFILQHYSTVQQKRLAAITSINASMVRDSNYLRLMQKVGLDLQTVTHNIEVG